MAFEDFKGAWKLSQTLGKPRCNHDKDQCELRVGGTPDDVTVTCVNLHPYETAKYDEASDTIDGGTYTLSLAGEPKLLHCVDSTGVPETGSWTAEDNGPGPALGSNG